MITVSNILWLSTVLLCTACDVLVGRYAVIASGCAGCPKLHCERPGCGMDFCYHCKQPWHANQTCTAARAKRLSSVHSLSSMSHSLDSNLGSCVACMFSEMFYRYRFSVNFPGYWGPIYRKISGDIPSLAVLPVCSVRCFIVVYLL